MSRIFDRAENFQTRFNNPLYPAQSNEERQDSQPDRPETSGSLDHESRPNELIRVQLEFYRPLAATSTAEFTFKPLSNQTAVTWSMFGQHNFMAKAIHLFINMDQMIGDSRRDWRR